MVLWKRLMKNRTTPEATVMIKNAKAKKNKRLRTNIAPRAKDIFVFRGMAWNGEDWYCVIVTTFLVQKEYFLIWQFANMEHGKFNLHYSTLS